MEDQSLSFYDDMDTKKGEIGSEGLFSPFTFICFALVVFLMGCLSLYSSSFYSAIGLGLPHHHFFTYQMIGAVGGLAFGLLLCFIPNLSLKNIHYVTASVAIILGMINILFPGLMKELELSGFISLLSVVSLVLFLANVVERTMKFEVIGFPLIWDVLVVLILCFMAALSGGMGWYLLSMFVVLAVLSYQGIRPGYLLYFFLFLGVVGVFLTLVVGSFNEVFFHSILEVDEPLYYDTSLTYSMMAVRGGGLWGVGLGNGIFKLGFLSDPYGEYVFTTLAEELGIFGGAILLLSLFIILVIGVRSSNRALKRADRFTASMTIGYTVIIVVSSLGNILHSLGVNPFAGLRLPLFSYGPFEEALFIIILCFLYKYIHLMGRGNERER